MSHQQALTVACATLAILNIGMGLALINLLDSSTKCWCKFDHKKWNEPPLN